MEDAFRSPASNLKLAATFMLAVFFVAIIGYRFAGWPWDEAVYMVIITVFSVGYGEVQPITEPWLRAWTVGVIVFGCTGMIFATGALIQQLTASQIQRALGKKNMEDRIQTLNHHTILCGFGRIGRMLTAQLSEVGASFIVIDQSTSRVEEAREQGCLVIQGEATDEDVLKEAGVERAKILATVLPDDAANVFITLSARNLNPNLQIIARGEVPSTERKLLQAGADRVVLPAHIGADRIAHLILHPNARQLLSSRTASGVELENHFSSLGLRMEEVEIGPHSEWANLSLREIESHSQNAFLPVAIIRENGAEEVSPATDAVLHPGDALLVLRRCRTT